MLSIFRKNTYLIELLEGITDFHNHILPGIDDGAEKVSDSVDLIEALNNIGVYDFVATPHVMNDYYPNTPNTIQNSFNRLKNHLPESVHMNYSAEYMMDQHFVQIISDREVMPISGNKVLVEMSYFQAPINLNEILFHLQNNSFSPILAHPERYTYWHSKDLHQFTDIKSRGCNLQLNMLSLSNHYGKRIQRTAFQLLENDLIDFIASDIHRMDHIEKLKTIKINSKYLSSIKKIVENSKMLFN